MENATAQTVVQFVIYLCLFLSTNLAIAKTAWVSPNGGKVSFQTETLDTLPPAEVFKDIAKYDQINFLPGVYKKKIIVRVKRNSENPLKIFAHPGTLVDGQSKPKKSGSPCFALVDSSHIQLEGFSFKNCWPTSIGIQSSHHILLKSLRGIGSRNFVKAKGFETSNITLENSEWTQDPSRQLWKTLPWESAHHGQHSYFNGSIFSSRGIRGEVTIRKNTIRDAFNGIRMIGDANRPTEVNKNIQIYENRFVRIRDNPIEPEKSAYNWWVHHNEIENAHAWFSFTELAGGFIYVFSNIGWNNESYGRENDHNGGTVLKFDSNPPFPTFPIYVFHNSWFAQGNYIRRDTTTRNLIHFNNLIFLQKKKKSTLTPENFHRSFRFENDLINVKQDKFTMSHWKNLLVIDPKLQSPELGKFELSKESPAIDAGAVKKIDSWYEPFYGTAPDIGAFEGSRRYSGPRYFGR